MQSEKYVTSVNSNILEHDTPLITKHKFNYITKI